MTPLSSGSLTIRGIVHGGQNPVAGATIQLYTVGSSGNASSATPMLTTPVTSGNGGNFSISSDYVCGQSSAGKAIPTGSDQVYIVATGGNPGLKEGTDNKALVLMAALGDCSKVPEMSFIEINEVTTVAAAWALAPFMTSYTDVGASSTNASGIENAFLDAALLADPSAGMAATLPANLSIETGKLYALADAVASCVNSDGTSGCSPLFKAATPSGGSAPGDTLTAALNIVKNPGQNVALVYKAIGDFPPFVTSLQQAPNDWTMSLTITGGGLATPTDLAIDAESNVWVTGQDGPLSVFGPQGAPLSATGFGVDAIAQVYAVAVDSKGDVWVTNFNGGGGQGSATEFYGSNSSSFGSIAGDYSDAIYYPDALSSDGNGNIFVADHDSSSATMYSSSGSLVYSGLGSSSDLNAHPLALAADGSGGFWLSDDDDTIAHISAPSASYPKGELLSHPSCCNETYGLATDADGNVWVADYLGGTTYEGAFAEIGKDKDGNTTVPISGSTAGGIEYPALVAVDAGQNVWFSNYRGGSITEIAGNHTSVPGGTALSPSMGTYGTISQPLGGYGRDALIDDPLGIAPDRSGNIWVTNEGTNTLVMFFGLATPTVTPVQPVPTPP